MTFDSRLTCVFEDDRCCLSGWTRKRNAITLENQFMWFGEPTYFDRNTPYFTLVTDKFGWVNGACSRELYKRSCAEKRERSSLEYGAFTSRIFSEQHQPGRPPTHLSEIENQ